MQIDINTQAIFFKEIWSYCKDFAHVLYISFNLVNIKLCLFLISLNTVYLSDKQ